MIGILVFLGAGTFVSGILMFIYGVIPAGGKTFEGRVMFTSMMVCLALGMIQFGLARLLALHDKKG